MSAEYESHSFNIVAQFPSIFEPTKSYIGERMVYSVVFQHPELPQELQPFIMPQKEGRVRATSNFPPPLVELSGQQTRLQTLLEVVASSRLTNRLLTLQPIMITARPYEVRHPLTRVPVALSLRTVGLYVTNLETRYEQLLDELREELKDQ